jgi:hypothetical protein
MSGPTEQNPTLEITAKNARARLERYIPRSSGARLREMDKMFCCIRYKSSAIYQNMFLNFDYKYLKLEPVFQNFLDALILDYDKNWD